MSNLPADAVVPPPSNADPQRAKRDAARTTGDHLFWLARIDDALPRITLVPDYKRSAARHVYGEVAFALDAEALRAMRGVDRPRGVSDVALCATLVTIALAQYHRDDEGVVGIAAPGPAGSLAVAPMRVDCDRARTIAETMRGIASEAATVLERLPSGALDSARILGDAARSGASALFNVAIVAGGDAAFDFASYPVDLAFRFDEASGMARGSISFAEDLYERASIEGLAAHVEAACRAVAARPDALLGDIDVLSPSERTQILRDFATRTARYPTERTLHALFEEQVAKTPDALAAIDAGGTLTYRELEARANRLAHLLLDLGITKGAFVGIFLPRGCGFLTAMLAVFKAGGAYVPLDPSYPAERLRYMLDDSEARVVVSRRALIESMRDGGKDGRRVFVSLDAYAAPPAGVVGAPDRLAALPDAAPRLPLAGGDRAYMIYTSGSTGRAKGAICRHAGAINHLFGELDGMGIGGPFRFMQSAASSSDISVWQFLAPLFFGGATVIVDYEVVVDPRALLAAMRVNAVTVAELVPVVLRELVGHVSELAPSERALPDLRALFATGEALAPELVDRWLELYPRVPIGNTYGPTETSDDVTLMVIRERMDERRAVVPIGPPLPNNVLFVLDRRLRPVPIGAPGELCVAGIGVGEGYWRQPEKTEAAFVACPFPELSAGPMYRTGDLARFLRDGSIEFLGRVDFQVKIRGFRVEPGEVEAMLTAHPAVKNAAVVAVADSTGNNRLVGYFVTHEGTTLASADLRDFLKARLADHMVPSTLAELSALPLTPLGKVDVKALMHAGAGASVRRERHVAPRNDTERMLAAAWSEALGAQDVGIHDNFFERGGDSILAIHVVAALRKAGIAIAPGELFRHPTIAELAPRVAATPAAPPTPGTASAARPDDGSLRERVAASFPDLVDVYPLAPTQRGIYFQSILPAKRSGAYVEQIAFDLVGDLDEAAFASAWQRTVDDTAALRTAIVRRGAPQPVQAVVAHAKAPIVVQDWRGLPAPALESALAAATVEDRQAGFDLGVPPLSRMTLTRTGASRWHVLWSYHHVVLDGWSEPLVLADLFRAYDAIVDGRAQAQRNDTPYRAFVDHVEALDMEGARRFWQRHLAGYAEPVRVHDESPAIEPPASGDLSHGFVETRLTAEDTARLADVAKRHHVTTSTVLHGAWALLLHRRTRAGDVVFGSVASGRQGGPDGIDSVRGVVVVTQPLRTREAPDASLASWMRLLQLQMAEVREFEQTPLALIQQWCDVPPAKRPLFDTLVVMANYAGSDLEHCHPRGMEIASVRYVTQPLYALTLFAHGGARLSIRIVYDKRRYAAVTARALLDEYVGLVTAFAETPERRVGGMIERG